MADPQISVEIRMLEEAQREMERIIRDLHGAPLLDAMREATVWVQTDAKRNAPVDTGRLRVSIVPEVRRDGETVLGVVGSNVHYAPYLETGTRPHWPPISALETWARRHGTTAYVVARAIARRGVRGRAYLQRALDAHAERIRHHIEDAIQRIVR